MVDGKDSSHGDTGGIAYITSNLKTSLNKVIDTGNGSVVARDCGWWYRELLMNTEFSFGVMKMS